jgi:hypothetical protein
MKINASTAPEHAIRVPHVEAAELTRLASDRRPTVDAILLAQLGPLRKLLHGRITTLPGVRSQGSGVTDP